MECPHLFHVAFFLGINPYSNLGSRTIFYCCGAFNSLYVTLVGALVVYSLIVSSSSNVVISAVMFRTFVTCYFIIAGLQDYHSTVAFYGNILKAIKESSRKKTHAVFDAVCVSLFVIVLPEIVVISDANIIKNVLYLISACFNTIIPLVTMAQFSLCCSSVHSLYGRLQEDIEHTFPRTAAFSICRLRVRQVETVYFIRDISNVFGLRLFLYILLIQMILLEKADYMCHRVASNTWAVDCTIVMTSFFGYLFALWYFVYCSQRAVGKHAEVLDTLMELPTREMDDSAVQEVVLLAEELHSRPTLFSASGCFTVGFNIFYSMIGIIFSYVMIVGPIALKKSKIN